MDSFLKLLLTFQILCLSLSLIDDMVPKTPITHNSYIPKNHFNLSVTTKRDVVKNYENVPGLYFLVWGHNLH